MTGKGLPRMVFQQDRSRPRGHPVAALIGAATVRERFPDWNGVLRILVAGAFFVAECGAQNLPFTIEKPSGSAILRPYRARTVPEARLNNSGRLNSLLRAGKLYLSVQDAIALAIENNLGLETDRYGPLLAQAALERA